MIALMRQKAEWLIRFGTHWTRRELREMCWRCDEPREMHALGVICLKPGFVGEVFCGQVSNFH